MLEEELQIPPHLRAGRRRLRHRANAWRDIWFMRIFCLPNTLAAFYFLFFAMPGIVIWTLFGHDYAARVSRIWTDKTAKGAVQYHAAFSYVLTNGLYRDQQTIELEDYVRLQGVLPDNHILRVRAIAVGPFSYHYAFGNVAEVWRHVGGVWAFGAIWCAAMGFVSIQMYGLPYRQRMLYRHGTAVGGVLTQKQKRRGRSLVYHLSYRFSPRANQDYEKEMTTSFKLWTPAQVNKPAIVLYDPADPKHSVLYDYGLYECVADRAV